MKKLLLALIISIGMVLPSLANSPVKPLIIVELSTGNKDSASAEFVEIYNPNSQQINLEGFTIDYKSANGDSWSSKSRLEGSIGVRGRVLAATSQLDINGAQKMSSGLSASGGHIRIARDSVEQDKLAWGSASDPKVAPAPEHEKPQSLKRYVSEDGYFINANDNSKDFFVSEFPSPNFDIHIEQASAKPNVIAQPTPNQTPQNQEDTQTTSSSSHLPVYLNELLIDPDKPLTDKDDEFIELFNPHQQPIDIEGYQVQSGSTWRYKHEFESTVIPAGGYHTIYSEESGVTLSNSGSQVRILDPSGELVDGVSYEKAKTGYSLAKFGDTWQWSETPTPNEQNVGAIEQESDEADEDQELAHVAGLSSSDDEAGGEQAGSFADDQSASEKTIDSRVLVTLGVLAILYALYEYRQDIANIIRKIRRHASSWRVARQEAKGRRDNRAEGRRWFRQNSLRSWFSERRRQSE